MQKTDGKIILNQIVSRKIIIEYVYVYAYHVVGLGRDGIQGNVDM